MTEWKETTPRVRDYLRYFRLQSHPALFRAETVRGLDAVERRYGDMEAYHVIYEIRLNREERGLDFSIGVETPGALFSDYWLELDESAWEDGLTEEPCRFWNVNALKADGEHETENGEFYDAVLRPAIGDTFMDAMRPQLDRVLSLTRNRCEGLYQIGFMRARGEVNRLRIFTKHFTGEALLSMLSDLGWRGDVALLGRYLSAWTPFGRKNCFELDFDLFPDGRISEKIGVTVYLKSKNPRFVRTFLDFLTEQGLCLPEKEHLVTAAGTNDSTLRRGEKPKKEDCAFCAKTVRWQTNR